MYQLQQTGKDSHAVSALEAVALCKTYNTVPALTELNLSVSPGEIFCLLGANGAGKTTTINLFLNFIEPSSGQAFISGLDVTKDTQRARSLLTYLPEQVSLYPELSAEENLKFLLALSPVPQNGPSITESLLEAGLDQRFHTERVGTYSKGMRQKVGIALAIARASRVLLLDEPTSGLDPASANEFGEIMLRLAARGSAVFMVTHDIFRARAIARRIGIMKSGRLVEVLEASSIETGALEELYLEHMRGPA